MNVSPDVESFRRDASVVAIASALQLASEMLVIKLGRYELGSLAIGAIGLAVLGVSIAAPLTSWLGDGERASRRAVVAAFPFASLAGAYFFSRPHVFLGEEHTYVAMLGCGFAALAMLALTSVPVFVALRTHVGSESRIYATSLGGATLGAPLTLLAMHVAGDVGAYVGLLGMLGVLLVLVVRERRSVSVAGVVVALIGCSFLYPHLDRAVHESSARIETDAISRIDVIRRPHGRLQIRTAGVNAGTSTAGGTVRAPPRELLTQLSANPFLAHPRRVLLLGAGAGKNAVQALAFRAEHVVAVEINPMIPRALHDMLAPEEDPYRDPRIELVVGEGREIAAERARRGERFDLVYVPIATLFGSSGHTFTETYLMTREAFAQYMGTLDRNGVVAAFFPDVVRAKVVVAMTRALADRGVADVDAHTLVLARDHAFVVLARPDAPFTAEERVHYRGRFAREVPVAEDRALGARQRPLGDDNPFLYNDLDSADGVRALYGWNLRFLRQAQLGAFALFACACVLFLCGSRSVAFAPRAGTLAAFVAMGAAYTAYQTFVLQRLVFLVGHPVLATAIVLPMTLLGSALGASIVARVPLPRWGLARSLGLGLLVVGTLPFVAVPPSSLMLPGVAPVVRCLVAAVLAAVPFVPLGTFFPVAFARIERDMPELATAAWSLNGLAAVVGSIAAILGPMLFGFRTACFPALVAYVALSLWDLTLRSRGPHVRAHLGLASVVLVGSLALVMALVLTPVAPE